MSERERVRVVRLNHQFIFTARRCNGEHPCDLAEWAHEHGNWLMFDQDDGGYHAEVTPEVLAADYVDHEPPAPTPPAGVEARARQVVLHCVHTYPEYAKRRSGACAECIAKALRV